MEGHEGQLAILQFYLAGTNFVVTLLAIDSCFLEATSFYLFIFYNL